jgi:hypothetical protein
MDGEGLPLPPWPHAAPEGGDLPDKPLPPADPLPDDPLPPADPLPPWPHISLEGNEPLPPADPLPPWPHISLEGNEPLPPSDQLPDEPFPPADLPLRTGRDSLRPLRVPQGRRPVPPPRGKGPETFEAQPDGSWAPRKVEASSAATHEQRVVELLERIESRLERIVDRIEDMF